MTDYEQQLQLARERALRYGQQAQYQAPQGRMVGNIYVAPNPLEYLAAGLRSLGGMRGQQMAQEEITQIGGERNKAMADALRGFTEKAQGRPAEVLPPDIAGPARPAEAPNLMGAYEALMSAPDAGYRQMGMQGQLNVAQQQAEQQRKAQENQRLMSILQSSTPQQAIAAGVPAETVKSYYESRNFGRDKVQFKDVGGELVPVTEFGDIPANVTPLQKTGDPFKDMLVRGASGELVPNQPLVQAKGTVARAGRSMVTVNNKGPEAFDVELAKLDAKQLDQWRDKSEQARSSLSTAQRLKAAEEQGAYSGGLADQKLAAANLINGITGVNPKGLVGSQLYNAEASKLVLEHIKGLGANPSNADREFIEKTVPRLATSKEAREAMVDFIERSAIRTIDTYDQMDIYARQNRGLKGFKFPEATPGKPGQTGQLSPQDQQAIDWANANSNDPRAAEIKRRLGVE
jgi:hypothetical protein